MLSSFAFFSKYLNPHLRQPRPLACEGPTADLPTQDASDGETNDAELRGGLDNICSNRGKPSLSDPSTSSHTQLTAVEGRHPSRTTVRPPGRGRPRPTAALRSRASPIGQCTPISLE